ncbi:hypothetical protein BJ912DRAFT_451579 [Pholiota molesta]|nr:hypothetical protein BJ912DRAFT_451579 [Pholiota molesta]
MSSLGIPVDIEKSTISSNLNTAILFFFLMGMYTIIYFGTIYIHSTRRSSKSALVSAAITILYLSVMVGVACQWYMTKWQFVDNGDTRDSVFLSLYTIPRWSGLVTDISFYISIVIADGLLIWRCFFVWNRSLRIISVSLLLIIAEIALFFVDIIFQAKYIGMLVPSGSVATENNDLLAAVLFISFGTTLVTTVLIAYRIYSVSKQQLPSSRRFNHIIDLVVQSGAIYSLSQLAYAITSILTESNAINTRIIAFADYASALNVAITGILPTIMVARVSLLSAETIYPSTSIHLSGLQFHAGTSHPTVDVETVPIIVSIDAGKTPAGEGQAVGKVQ